MARRGINVRSDAKVSAELPIFTRFWELLNEM
jgi:hypothetical protein